MCQRKPRGRATDRGGGRDRGAVARTCPCSSPMAENHIAAGSASSTLRSSSDTPCGFIGCGRETARSRERRTEAGRETERQRGRETGREMWPTSLESTEPRRVRGEEPIIPRASDPMPFPDAFFIVAIHCSVSRSACLCLSLKCAPAAPASSARVLCRATAPPRPSAPFAHSAPFQLSATLEPPKQIYSEELRIRGGRARSSAAPSRSRSSVEEQEANS